MSVILVWERTGRLEAGLKRAWPDAVVRACRSAGDVLAKRDAAGESVLLLDTAVAVAWVKQFDHRDMAAVQTLDWLTVIAIADTKSQDHTMWTSTGITAVLTGPVRDGRLARVCRNACHKRNDVAS